MTFGELANRQAVFDALAGIPDGVWAVYLIELRAANDIVGMLLLEDPTPTLVLEEAIAKVLGK